MKDAEQTTMTDCRLLRAVKLRGDLVRVTFEGVIAGEENLGKQIREQTISKAEVVKLVGELAKTLSQE